MTEIKRYDWESDLDYRARVLSAGIVEVERDQEPGDDWPYPDAYVLSDVPDSLRDAVRKRVGKPEGTVQLYTREISTGYSEYTQETDYEHELRVDGETVFEYAEYGYSYSNGLVALLAWLDEPATAPTGA